MVAGAPREGWFPRFWVAVTVTSALALAVVLIPLLTIEPDKSSIEEKEPPPPGIELVSTQVVSVPPAPKRQLQDIEAHLSKFMTKLYEDAFVNVEQDAKPRSIGHLFGRKTLPTFRKQRDVFRPAPGLLIRNGRLRINGFTTLVERRPTEAMIGVQFRARAENANVEMRQVGTLRLLRTTSGGWRIVGFELNIRSVKVPPPPSPTPGVRR